MLAAGALALSLAVPAAAAPIRNPHVSTWEIICDQPLGTFTVIAKGVPGWPTDFERGTAPIHLRAAIWNIYENGETIDDPYVMTAPKGLESKLVGPCYLHLYGQDTSTFDMVGENAYFQFP